MSSNETSPAPLAELSLPATEEDVAALRRAAAATRIAPEDYLRFLSQFKFSQESLRARKGPRGEPFKL